MNTYDRDVIPIPPKESPKPEPKKAASKRTTAKKK